MPKTIASQIAALQLEFESRPEGLLRHVQRVLVEALDLAERFDLDPARVELATWGHDLFRSSPPEEQLRLATDAGLSLEVADRADPVLLHGPIAAVTLRERFGVDDEEALAAVRDHTLGAPEMPMIAKVILLADKCERRKRERTPVMKAIRRLAHRDLDLALLCWADWKWVEEREHGWESHPKHWAARRRWISEHLAEIGLPARGQDGKADALPLSPADAQAFRS
jgi:predicted HD superfamily hydrolase involved in NAD metabolism